MNNHASPLDPFQWRYQYSADKEHWLDVNRFGRMVIPVVLLWFIASMTAIAYVSIHSIVWSQDVHTGFQNFFFVLRIILAFIAPLLMIGIGAVLILRVVRQYVADFYSRFEEPRLTSRILLKLFGVPPLPPPLGLFFKYPLVIIRDANDLPPDHWTRWFGGPAILDIYDGTALYLERGNCFSRVIGPGPLPYPFLERYETIKAVVDLRPQFPQTTIRPWTKDGIQVELSIQAECQVFTSDISLVGSNNLVYPFDPQAVKEAVEFTSVKRNPETGELYESNWLDGTLSSVISYLSSHISRHTADELALAELEDIGPSEGNLHTFELARGHIQEINTHLTMRKSGTHVNNIHLVLKFPPEVEEKRLAYWKSEHERLSIIRDTIAEAQSIRISQEARANAEKEVIDSITERLLQVGPENMTEPLLLSLAGVLDNSLDDPLIRPFVAKSSLELLEKLKKILDERY